MQDCGLTLGCSGLAPVRCGRRRGANRQALEDESVPKGSGRALSLSWLAAFVILPLSAWFTVAHRNRFAGKSLSNLTLEPMLVVVASGVVFVAWLLMARGSLKPLAGVILLVILSAAAIAVQLLVPGLRE